MTNSTVSSALTEDLGTGAYMWESFVTSSIGQWDMLEAYLSGTCFAVFIIFFRLLDQIPSMQKYRISQDTKPIPLFQPDPNNSWVPLLLYLVAIHLFHHWCPKPLPEISSPSGFRVVFEVITGIFAYDFIFFWLHYAMHVVPQFEVFCHHVHHKQSILCSSEVQHHSLLDGTFQVLVNILVQRLHTPFGAKHYLSRLLHNIVITYMLTEIHAGYDCWWSLHRIFPRLIGGARRHHIHHKNGNNGNYQQFFMYIDDYMGTSTDSPLLTVEPEVVVSEPKIKEQ